MNPDTPILVVEDSEIQQVMIRRILLKHGYKVVSANNGAVGLQMMEEHLPALVLSDINMPVMGGYEMCRRIKSNPRLKGIPVILLTDIEDPSGVMRGIESLADGYITKPYDADYLMQKTEYFLKTEEKVDSSQESGIDMEFAGEHYTIYANRHRILRFLLLTYENTMRQNAELTRTKKELNELNGQLDEKVKQRTFELTESNTKLAVTLETLKNNQSLLIQMEKMAALGQLGAGVAHEIKNPLNIISMTIQILQMKGELSTEEKEMYGRVMDQVGRMVKIIDNLRDYARERKPEINDLNIVELLKKTVMLMEYEMKGEGIIIEQRFCAASIAIKGDRDQLAQVFLNFLTNARFSMNEKKMAQSAAWKEGGKVWMGLLCLSVEKEDGFAVIKFSDNGMGIPEKVIKRIFDPFFTTKAEGNGTGLGLSISHGIIENHHGKIEVKSEEGENATFTIRLPLSEMAEEQLSLRGQ